MRKNRETQLVLKEVGVRWSELHSSNSCGVEAFQSHDELAGEGFLERRQELISIRTNWVVCFLVTDDTFENPRNSFQLLVDKTEQA